MKKILGMIICLSVLLSSFYINVNAANYSEDIQDSYDFLRKLEIINNDTDIEKASEMTVTRMEYAELVANAMRITRGMYTDQKYFLDVDGLSVVNDLCKAGYIKQADYFNPQNNITLEEAYIIAVRALGFEDYASVLGGKGSDYIRIARQISLSGGTDYSGNATYADVITLLFNMLHTGIFDTSVIGNDKISYNQSKDTLLNILYNIYTVEGVISANDHLSLHKNVLFSRENNVTVNGIDYYFPDAGELVGQYARLYYKDDEKKTGVFVYRLNKYFDEYEISAKDVFFISFDNLSFYNKDGRKVNVKLKNPLYIYNSEALFDYSLQDIQKLKDLDRAVFRIVKYDSLDQNDLVFVDAYKNGVIKTVNKTSETIYADFYGKAKDVKCNEGEYEYLSIIKDGNKISVDDLKEKQIVSVFESYNGEIMKIVVSDETVIGVISNIYQEGDTTYYVIDSTKYEVDKNIIFDSLSTGTSRTFRTDAYGRIASFETKTDNVIGYIYARSDQSNFDPVIRYKIFDETGKHGVYQLNNKVELDGVTYTAVNVDDMLKKPDGSHKQFIMFSLNSEGNIIKIDSCMSDNGIRMVGKNLERRTIKYDNGFTGYQRNAADPIKDVYCSSSNTIKFTVPDRSVSGYSEDVFKITSAINTIDQLDYMRTYELYKTNDESEFLDFVVQYVKYGADFDMPEENTTPVMVADIYCTLKDDEVRYVINGQLNYANPPTSTTYLNDRVRIKKVDGSVVEINAEEIGNYISQGDLIQIGEKDGKGNVSGISIAFDYSEEKAAYCYNNDGSYEYKIEQKTYDELRSGGTNGGPRAMYGYVYDMDIGSNTFSVCEILSDGQPGPEHERIGVSSTRVPMYDSGRRGPTKVTTTNPADVIGVQNSNGLSGHKAFVFYGNYIVRSVFFYK